MVSLIEINGERCSEGVEGGRGEREKIVAGKTKRREFLENKRPMNDEREKGLREYKEQKGFIPESFW